MTWTAPATMVAGDPITASFFNQQVRDNLLETMPGKATAAHQLFVASGSHALQAQTPGSALVSTSQSTTSSTYGALATAGPAVTATVVNGAVVGIYAAMTANASAAAFMSVTMSGANTAGASDARAISTRNTSGERWGNIIFYNGLSAGSTTFTAQYRSGSSTFSTTYADRRMFVLPF